MHPSSLPSRGGIGDLGPAAYEFVDWLAAAKQTLWQCSRSARRIRQFALFLYLGFRRKYSADQPGAAGGARAAGARTGVDSFPTAARRSISTACASTSFPCCAKPQRTFCDSATGDSRARYDAFCSENAGGWKTTFCSAFCASASTSRPGTPGRQRSPAASRRRIEKSRRELASRTRRRALSAVRFLSSSGAPCVATAPSAAFASSATSPFSSAMTVPTSGRILRSSG